MKRKRVTRFAITYEIKLSKGLEVVECGYIIYQSKYYHLVCNGLITTLVKFLIEKSILDCFVSSLKIEKI